MINIYFWIMSSSITLNKDNIIFNTTEYANPTTQTTTFPSIGTMLLWGGSDITKLPSNYLPCDGRSLSNTTYSSLFGVIGYMYSATNTGSNFNIPNMQSKFAIGSNAINTKQLQTSTLINSVSGGMKQITDAHFPHNHDGPKTITYVKHAGSSNIETYTGGNWRSQGFFSAAGPWQSGNPLDTSNTTSYEYYPQYCIIIYIIRVS